MAEENEQENNEEQNQEPEQEEQVVIDGKVRYNPETDNKEWQKMLAITISAFLGGFLAIYFIADRMNHEKAIKAEQAKIAKQNARNHKARTHNARIKDYKMTYEGGFPEEDFIEKQIKEIESEQDKVLKHIAVNAKLRPVTVSAVLEGDVFKVTVRADNYKDEDIKYKFDKKNLTVYGKTKVEQDGFIKEIEFSNDLYLPAKPKKELLKTYREGEDWILTVPLDIDD